MTPRAADALTKVPAVTLGFWVIKILATTLGETGGDSVSMSWLGETTAAAGQSGLNGYLVGTLIFGLLLGGLVWAQVRARQFNPWLYWATIVASTTAGTTLADFADRSLGIGYSGGALAFGAALLVVAALYYFTRASRVTLFWAAFILTRPLGATVGDFFDKPVAKGGLDVSRPVASLILLVVIVVLILALPQRPARHPAKAR